MTDRLSFRIVPLALVCLAVLWASPALARLYPPCQDVHWYQQGADSIVYWAVDPVSKVEQWETWSVSQAYDERIIESVQLDEGILTWVARYKNWLDHSFSYQVHLRIYDPGRGGWKEDAWTFLGSDTWIGQHQVKHGAVAWTAHRKLDDGRLEHKVVTATYDPNYGFWSWDDSHAWQVPWNSPEGPEVLRVKNGVVAWPMINSSGQCSGGFMIRVYATIYDYEVHKWVSVVYITSTVYNVLKVSKFDWIDIPDDLATVRDQFTWFFYLIDRHEFTNYISYDPFLHEWGARQEDIDPEEVEYFRRAFFVAQPESLIVPLRVWFWDCSTSMDGKSHPSSWSWEVAPGETLTDRSPSFRYTSPGQYTVTEKVYYNAVAPVWTATGTINALSPVAPTGGISINNDTPYTTSANVTLSLNYGPSATEMCFREFPGSLWWTSWQPVAASREWTLSAMHTMGETSDGVHTVYVKYRDQYGTESAQSQDAITLVLTPPVGSLTLNNGEATTLDPSVTATWSAVSNYAMQMSYCAYNAGDTKVHWSSWEAYQPTTRTFDFSSVLGKKTVMVQFKDVAGNITQTQAVIELLPPVPPSADLSISMTDSPDPVMTGSPITYTVSITNTGPDDSTINSLMASIEGTSFYSAAASQGGCVRYDWGAFCNFGNIAAGESVTATLMAMSPGAPGTLTARATAVTSILDPNQSNDTVEVTTTVYSPTNPDLVETTLTDPPLSAMPGWSFPVTDTVKNQGSAAAGASTTRYYLSLDTTKSSGDILLEGSRSVSALAAGQSSAGSTNYTIPSATPAGAYYLLACADDLGAVSESNESNNCMASADKLQVTGGGLSDLVESAVSNPPATAAAGGTFDVTDTVMNQGGDMAGYSTTRYYLSLDTVKSAGDVLLSGTRTVGALLPLGGLMGTVTVTVPTPMAGGSYYLLACADDLGAVSESDETNNCRASASKVSVAEGPPDLVETALTDPPVSAMPGWSFPVTDTAKNQGSGGAGASSTRYYLSLDTTRSSGDILLEGSRSVGALAAGESSAGGTNYTIPSATPAGAYYLLACADDLGAVSESNETNNCMASAGMLQVTGGGLPDLVETAVSNPPAAVTAGGTFEATDTVVNQGGDMAGASTTRYYLSLDAVKSTGDVPIGSRDIGALLPPGGSQGTVIVTVPAFTAAGSYYLLACADDLGIVSESNETNNCRASAGKVQVTAGATISVLSISPANRDFTKGAGSTTFSVSNTGTGEMPWIAEVQPGDGWLQILNGASGNNDGTITCTFGTNTGTSARTGALRITATGAIGSPKYVSVAQQVTGDVNNDGHVDLVDAILCLQVLCGLLPDNMNTAADVNGDGKIGMAEAIYAMRKAAGL